MIKKIMLTGLIVCNLFAIGGMDSLIDEEKNVAKKLQKVLDISQNNAFRLYTGYFQTYLNKKQWQIHWFDNNDPSKGKMSKLPNKTMFVSLINKNRIINFSIVKFPNISQLLIYTIETLPRKSALVIEKFNGLEKDNKFTKDRETVSFAYFSKKGYMEKVNIFVSSPVGAIQYTDLGVFDLK